MLCKKCHVSAAVHEPCVQCCTAMQAAAMCLLQCHAGCCHVSAAVHEPCVQCCTAMQAAAMCLLQCHAGCCHVSAAVHEPCVQCRAALQAAAMCLLHPVCCSRCGLAEDGAALPDNTRPQRGQTSVCALLVPAAASTITKSVRRLQQRLQSCTAQPHGETIASSRQ